ncbi:MAG TPA: hypothetical protein VKJ45_05895 [Blastocatellia bacterium]|nr:hypothetical protein [Blastocatellia bacterium]
MNEQIKPTIPKKRRRIAIAELLLAASTVVAAVVAVAMTEPKIPPFSGD